MTVITKRASVSELSQQILQMAKTGVYRESVFEALQPLATKKQIRLAIAYAKQFGLHSVAAFRDQELGTYYALDIQRYESLKKAIGTQLVPEDDLDVMTQLVDTTVTVRLMLATVKSLVLVFLLGSALCLITGQQHISLGLVIAAVSAGLIWTLQKAIANRAGA